MTALRLRKNNMERNYALVIREFEGIYCVCENSTKLSRAVGYRRKDYCEE